VSEEVLPAYTDEALRAEVAGPHPGAAAEAEQLLRLPAEARREVFTRYYKRTTFPDYSALRAISARWPVVLHVGGDHLGVLREMVDGWLATHPEFDPQAEVRARVAQVSPLGDFDEWINQPEWRMPLSALPPPVVQPDPAVVQGLLERITALVERGTKPVVPEVAPLVREFKALPGNEAGGSLHIVLDDYNETNADVDFCIRHAIERGDALGEAMARLLRLCSRTQRLKVAHQS
jgi:hypothetical protein